MLTLLFGALPSTFHFVFVPSETLTMFWPLHILGTYGFYRVAIYKRFTSRFSFYLLASGLVAFWAVIVFDLAGPLLLFGRPDHGWGWEAVPLVVAPAVTAFAYLVAMVRIHARDRSGQGPSAS